MADDALVWLVWGIGVATGISFLVPVLYFLVKNRLRKDWVWLLIRGRDGRFRTRETRPDKSHLHLKDATYEMDGQHVSTFKKGFLQSPRTAFLYTQGDPRPINLQQQRVPELDKDGKPTGALIVVTNPAPMFKPAEVWQAELGSHIVSEALGRSRTELLLLIVALLALVGIVIGIAQFAR